MLTLVIHGYFPAELYVFNIDVNADPFKFVHLIFLHKVSPITILSSYIIIKKSHFSFNPWRQHQWKSLPQARYITFEICHVLNSRNRTSMSQCLSLLIITWNLPILYTTYKTQFGRNTPIQIKLTATWKRGLIALESKMAEELAYNPTTCESEIVLIPGSSFTDKETGKQKLNQLKFWLKYRRIRQTGNKNELLER